MQEVSRRKIARRQDPTGLDEVARSDSLCSLNSFQKDILLRRHEGFQKTLRFPPGPLLQPGAPNGTEFAVFGPSGMYVGLRRRGLFAGIERPNKTGEMSDSDIGRHSSEILVGQFPVTLCSGRDRLLLSNGDYTANGRVQRGSPSEGNPATLHHTLCNSSGIFGPKGCGMNGKPPDCRSVIRPV